MAALLAMHEIPSAAFSPGALAELPAAGAAWSVSPAEVGRCRLTLSNPRLKRLQLSS